MITDQTVHNVEQGIASYVDYINNIRLCELMNALESILTKETSELSELAIKSANSLSNLDWAKTEIANLISTNRGGETGIHGFISEIAETGIRNSREVYEGLRRSVELLNDNGPADIILYGEEVQMKFYENIIEEIKQSSKYGKMSMMFPKDHYEVIEEIMNGAKSVKLNNNVLSISKINNIKSVIEEQSILRGESYEKWLKPSVLSYDEVKKESINKTISDEVKSVNKQTSQLKSDIRNNSDIDRLDARQVAKPSFSEASRVASVGAIFQGGMNLGIFVYQKRKEGKDVWNFEVEDWKECGVTAVEGGIRGGLSGYSIYGLTNACQLAAPSAGAITSGTFGISQAVVKYRKGDIDTDEFIDLVTLNAIDATGSAIGAAIGQSIIPVPVVGALVGSIVVISALSLGKGVLNKREIEAINRYQEELNYYVNELEDKYQMILQELLIQYNELGELQQYSFDINVNVRLRFISSVCLAGTVGVPKLEILKNEEEIDDYFLS